MKAACYTRVLLLTPHTLHHPHHTFGASYPSPPSCIFLTFLFRKFPESTRSKPDLCCVELPCFPPPRRTLPGKQTPRPPLVFLSRGTSLNTAQFSVPRGSSCLPLHHTPALNWSMFGPAAALPFISQFHAALPPTRWLCCLFRMTGWLAALHHCLFLS